MKLTEDQIKSVGRAYEAMVNIAECAKDKHLICTTMLCENGDMFANVCNVKPPSLFLYDIKNRTIAEIEKFENDVLSSIRDNGDAAREKKIAELRKELEILGA